MWAAGYADSAGALDAETVAELLLERGAAIEAQDNRGYTALMIAADAGHGGIVDLLLRRGATRDTKGQDGKTARDLATDAPVRERLAR